MAKDSDAEFERQYAEWQENYRELADSIPDEVLRELCKNWFLRGADYILRTVI